MAGVNTLSGAVKDSVAKSVEKTSEILEGNPSDSSIKKIKDLHKLKKDGVISGEEFNQTKERILKKVS